MALDIYQMNVRFWETLVLSTLKSGLIKTSGRRAFSQEIFGRQQDKNVIVQYAVDEIIQQEKEKLSVKNETHENIDDKFDEYELYEIDKTSLDEKE